jgi:hypothetical protein
VKTSAAMWRKPEILGELVFISCFAILVLQNMDFIKHTFEDYKGQGHLNIFSYTGSTFTETGDMNHVGTAFSKYSQQFQIQFFIFKKQN